MRVVWLDVSLLNRHDRMQVAVAEHPHEDGDVGKGPRYGWGWSPGSGELGRERALAHLTEQNYRAPRWAVFEMVERRLILEGLDQDEADARLDQLVGLLTMSSTGA